MKANAPVQTAAHIPPLDISTPPPQTSGSASDASPAQHTGSTDSSGTPAASDTGANGAIKAKAVTTNSVLARISRPRFTIAIYSAYVAKVKKP